MIVPPSISTAASKLSIARRRFNITRLRSCCSAMVLLSAWRMIVALLVVIVVARGGVVHVAGRLTHFVRGQLLQISYARLESLDWRLLIIPCIRACCCITQNAWVFRLLPLLVCCCCGHGAGPLRVRRRMVLLGVVLVRWGPTMTLSVTVTRLLVLVCATMIIIRLV